MKKMCRTVHLCFSFALLLMFSGCNTNITTSVPADSDETKTSTFTTQNAVDLLDKIIASDAQLEATPVHVSRAKIDRKGCTMTVDWMEFEQRPANAVKIRNHTEETEEITVSSAYLYSKSIPSDYVGQQFADYVQDQEDGAVFVFYKLDDNVLFVTGSEQ